MVTREFPTLVERFLRNDLRDDEADHLIAELQKSEEARRYLQHNIQIDFLLKKDISIQNDCRCGFEANRRADQQAKRPNGSCYTGSCSGADAATPRAARASRVLLRVLRKCVWPTARDREESIAPVMTLFLFLAVAVSFFFFYLETRSPRRPITTLARVNEVIDAVWEPGKSVYHRGQLVNESSFNLQSGLVQIEMNNGITVVFEGPASWQLEDALHVTCQSGRVSAQVSPEGHGFTIATPFGNVTDLGTEFFLDVSDSNIQTHVVRGKVKCESPRKESILLKASQSAYCDSTGKIQRQNVAPAGYVSRAFLKEKAFDHTMKIQNDLALENARTDENPQLLLRLDMNRDKLRRIRNESEMASELQPVRIRGELVEGNLFGTHAVSFSRKKDGLLLDVSDRPQGMTLDALIQINLSETRTHVLCASHELGETPGAFLWQVTREGSLQVQFTPDNLEGLLNYTTLPCIKQSMDGTWVHVRAVFDPINHRVAQYVNGRPQRDATTLKVWSRWETQSGPVPGNLLIGNYDGKLQTGSDRTLKFPLSQFRMWQGTLYPNDDTPSGGKPKASESEAKTLKTTGEESQASRS